MTINRMHSRLERKTEKFEIVRRETLNALDFHTQEIDKLITAFKSSKLYELRDDIRHQIMASVLGMSFDYFIDREMLLSIGFWSNSNRKNLLAEIRERIETRMKSHVGYHPSKRSSSGFIIEGSNDAEVYTIMWEITVKCMEEYRSYIQARTRAYHDFFQQVKGWVYTEGNYTRDYDFFVESPRSGVSEYIDKSTIGKLRPLTY